MKKFIQKIVVDQNHLDELNHVNNIQYLRWAQQIAKSHWQFLIKNIKTPVGIWVVRNHEIEYRISAFLNDHITISTFIETIKGPISIRIVEFHDSKSKKLISKVITKWCYLNNNDDKKITFVPDTIQKLINSDELDIE